jgi:leader peptidase (prepilin peptidase) / N-methyltransferase
MRTPVRTSLERHPPRFLFPSFLHYGAVRGFTLYGFRFVPMVTTGSLVLLCLASLWLAVTDLRFGVIPNWLNLAIAVAGLGRAALVGGSAAALAAACEGLAVGAVLWLLRYLFFRWRKYHGLGLGDVKLVAASGIWIGIAGVPVQLLIASLSALLAAGLLRLSGHLMTRQSSLPFGPFLALGLLTAFALQQAGWMSVSTEA